MIVTVATGFAQCIISVLEYPTPVLPSLYLRYIRYIPLVYLVSSGGDTPVHSPHEASRANHTAPFTDPSVATAGRCSLVAGDANGQIGKLYKRVAKLQQKQPGGFDVSDPGQLSKPGPSLYTCS